LQIIVLPTARENVSTHEVGDPEPQAGFSLYGFTKPDDRFLKSLHYEVGAAFDPIKLGTARIERQRLIH
jgi:hypothetical protein